MSRRDASKENDRQLEKFFVVVSGMLLLQKLLGMLNDRIGPWMDIGGCACIISSSQVLP